MSLRVYEGVLVGDDRCEEGEALDLMETRICFEMTLPRETFEQSVANRVTSSFRPGIALEIAAQIVSLVAAIQERQPRVMASHPFCEECGRAIGHEKTCSRHSLPASMR